MIQTIVVEDEWYNLEEISELIEETGFMTVKKKYQNPLMALEDITKICPQVAFIDIEMPELDGLTLAEKILEKDPTIIIAFITAWNQYAVQAFDLNALDYVLKPIKIDRFNRMVQKIQDEINVKQSLKSATLKIKCFDKLETSINDVPIKWERAKAEELFAYLLMNHGRYVHKDIIVENIWNGYEHVKALPILQTSICKIRNIFSRIKEEITLDYSRGSYCLVVKNGKCDYLDFENLLAKYKSGNRYTYEAIDSACSLFGNGFLTKQGYIWNLGKDQELRKKLVVNLKEIILEYSEEENYEELHKYLKSLSILEPHNEEVSYRLLSIYKRLGSNLEILNHYQWLKKILKSEYDMTPSKRIMEIVNNSKRS